MQLVSGILYFLPYQLAQSSLLSLIDPLNKPSIDRSSSQICRQKASSPLSTLKIKEFRHRIPFGSINTHGFQAVLRYFDSEAISICFDDQRRARAFGLSSITRSHYHHPFTDDSFRATYFRSAREPF